MSDIRPMRLAELARALPEVHITGPIDGSVSGLAYDSRQAAPGSLFVAVPAVGGDARSGGYRFLEGVVAAGATAVVTQAPADLPGITTLQVPDARRALALLAAEFYGHPSAELQLFAITGTDGKTTTTFLLDGILRALGFSTGLMGTVETRIGDRRERHPARMTTPEAPDVQRSLRQMVDAGVTHAALEASSHALALDRLVGCSFTACALTNITADHLEFHGSREAYIAAKETLFSRLAPDRPAVLNRDDPEGRRLAERLGNPLLTYGRKAGATVRAADLRPDLAGVAFTAEYGEGRYATRVPMPGEYNVLNGLAAIGLALAAGLPPERVIPALAGAEPPPGRVQAIDAGQGFRVLVDYAHTPHAFRSVLTALRATTLPPARLIAVFGATGNRDHDKRPALARIARELTDFFYITNEDPFGEQAEAIIADVRSGVASEPEGEHFVVEPDRETAIRAAVRRARPGDTVVLLGKGHERSIAMGDRLVPFNDAEVATAALRERE